METTCGRLCLSIAVVHACGPIAISALAFAIWHGHIASCVKTAPSMPKCWKQHRNNPSHLFGWQIISHGACGNWAWRFPILNNQSNLHCIIKYLWVPMFLNLQTYSTQYEFSMLVMILLTPGWGSRISFILFFMQHYIFLGALLYTVVVEIMCGLI